MLNLTDVFMYNWQKLANRFIGGGIEFIDLLTVIKYCICIIKKEEIKPMLHMHMPTRLRMKLEKRLSA